MLEKKIALLTSVTFNNIGNGFIDLGAEAALMKALPLNAELFKVSSNANFAATMGQMLGQRIFLVGKLSFKRIA